MSSNNQPDSQSECKCPSECKCKSETLYLQEAVRLSELAITEQNSASDTIERKAALLVTLYVAIIAYLLSWAGSMDNKVITIIPFIIIFIIAAFIGAWTLYTRDFGVPGANPEYLMKEVMQGKSTRNFSDIAKDSLNRYNNLFTINDKVLAEKLICLKLSLRLGGTGIFLVCIWSFWSAYGAFVITSA